MDKRDKKEMNRREFLKIVGVSTVASTVAMYGCASGEKSNASEASILGEVPVDKMKKSKAPSKVRTKRGIDESALNANVADKFLKGEKE